MKPIYILQTYLIKELLKTLFLALVVVTSILFMAMLLQLIGKLSVIDIGAFVGFLPHLIFYLLGYTLPLAILVSTTLTFGKFAADNEIVAMKACGISPTRIMKPVIVFSLFICLFCFYLSDQVIPNSHLKKRELMQEAIETIIKTTMDQEGSTIDANKDFRISYFKYENGIFYGLVIHRIDAGKAQEKLASQRGSLKFDKENQNLIFELFNGTITKLDHRNPKGRDAIVFEKFLFPIPISKKSKDRATRPKYRTIRQLLFEDVDKTFEKNKFAENRLARFWNDEAVLMTPEKKSETKNHLEGKLKDAQKDYRRVLFEIHRRIAFSMASLFWVLIAMGISLLNNHRVLSFGLSAISVTTIYYPLLMLGERLVMKGYNPIISMWLANIATGLVGGVLVWRALKH